MSNIELNHVKKIRKKLNMTQQQLSDLSCIARSTISDIENFKEIPSQYTLVALSSALKREPWEVFNLNTDILDSFLGRNTDIS